MKKFRLLMLLVLTLIFIFSMGTMTVLAEDQGEGGTGVVDTEVATYSNLFSGNDFAITKEDGLKISLNKVGAEATSKNFFSIGESGEYFVFDAKVDVTSIEDSELFYVRLLPDSSSSSDTVHFFYKKDATDSTEKVYVTFNTDKVEFELDATAYTLADETVEEETKRILTFTDIKVEIVDKKVLVNDVEVGDALNIYPYAKLQVYAKSICEFNLNSIYRLDGSNNSICKADFTVGTSSFKYGAEYYFNETDSFFAREDAIYGVKYNVVLVAYDFLSGVDKSLRFTKVSDINGTPVAETVEKTAENYAELTFGSQGVYTVEMKVHVVDADYNASKTELEEKYETLLTKTITVVKESDNTSVGYFTIAEKENEYKQIVDEIKEKVGGDDKDVKINIGDNFYYPSINEVIKSKYFDSSTLTYTLCYASKANSDYVTTTNKYFEVGQIGKYRFFILPKDECGNGYTYDEDFKDTYEVIEDTNGNLGWALKGSSDILIPVFTFEIYDNSSPEITVGKENNAFIGKQYKVTSLTINATNYDTEYKLYFMSDADYKAYELANNFKFSRESFKDDLDNYDTKAYNDALEALIAEGKLVEIPNLQDLKTDEKVSDAFDTTNISFTPSKGHYYLVCTVVAENGMSSYAITDSISALTAPTSAKFEKETVKKFFKNNKTSVIALSIGALSLVGIIVLLSYKPKTKESSEEV